MLTLAQIRKNSQILEFIRQSKIALGALGYTEHGLRHANFVAERAREITKKVGLSQNQQELAAIAGFCHDMGNFLSRNYHHYLGALLFHQLFHQNFKPGELSLIMEAISNHDREEMAFSNPISAVVVLADKSDVRRTRVLTKDINKIKRDIHDRVNYGCKFSKIKIDKKKKRITLILKIDTNFVPIMEYFEIFTYRMTYCRKAAQYLGYQFGLVINKFRLL
jgi:hypothetical protein